MIFATVENTQSLVRVYVRRKSITVLNRGQNAKIVFKIQGFWDSTLFPSGKRRTLFTSTLDLELRKKLLKCYIWSIGLYGAETWTLRALDQKHLESFEMWRWRRMEKICWTDHVRNKEVFLRVKEQRNILHEIRKRKANWIGRILRRNCLLQRVIEGKIQERNHEP